MFEQTLYAGWGDMDFNAHMKNTAYLDKSADVRMMYFAQQGYPASEFLRLKIGPVVMRDELEYFREIHLLEEMKVNLAFAGLSDDGSRMSIRNEFTRADGKLAARVTTIGGWMNLSARKLIAPPPALFEVMKLSPQTADFQRLASSIGP